MSDADQGLYDVVDERGVVVESGRGGVSDREMVARDVIEQAAWAEIAMAAVAMAGGWFLLMAGALLLAARGGHL